ncbi:ribosomal protein L1p/L10e family-domain-containing protein [Coniella lustricola]|uniref:Ribosomal protein L1p/L10e family-domain-containing protein n=1 Tax=Coniella lustricola TaxID=2025994 RepID=A0A2T3ABU0_9PEZI|nr:ribosomal protein L1p/L10e family-domain-containing protein [Coniella lustricola]
MAPSKAVVKQAKASQFEVDPDQALKASKALLAHIKKTAAETAASATKKNILDVADDNDSDKALSLAETPIWLTITTKRHIHDSKKLQPAKIALPHPLSQVDDDDESPICLIVADPQRHYKNLVADDAFPEKLRKRITRVIDLKHLTAKYKQYEAQRKLAAEHDVFLADDRIINRLPKALGKSFYKSTTKRPIPVVFARKAAREENGKKVKRDVDDVNCRPVTEVAAEIEKALGCALVHLSPSTNTAVKVGLAGQDAKAIAENIVKVSNEIANKYVPKKKNGIRAIFVKGPQTVALPIYQDTELWVDAETDVIAKGSDMAKAIEAKREQANVGKKRKTVDGDEDEESTEPKSKKAKKDLPAGDDDKLDKQIAARKSKLRGAKAKAKSAIDA